MHDENNDEIIEKKKDKAFEIHKIFDSDLLNLESGSSESEIENSNSKYRFRFSTSNNDS